MWFFSNFCLSFLVLDLEKEADGMEGESDQHMVLQVLLPGICSKQFKEVKQRYSEQCLGCNRFQMYSILNELTGATDPGNNGQGLRRLDDPGVNGRQ